MASCDQLGQQNALPRPCELPEQVTWTDTGQLPSQIRRYPRVGEKGCDQAFQKGRLSAGRPGRAGVRYTYWVSALS